MSSMSLPVIANLYRIALKWSNGALATAVNVLHVQAPTLNSADVWAALDANVTAGMWNSQGASAYVFEAHVTRLDGSTATFQAAPTGAKWTGIQTGENIPALATIIKLVTATRGPAHRGRLYLPFVAEASTSYGTMVGAIRTGQQTPWNTFLTAMAAANAPLVVASYKHASASLVTAVLVESVFGTQRRRQTRLRS